MDTLTAKKLVLRCGEEDAQDGVPVATINGTDAAEFPWQCLERHAVGKPEVKAAVNLLGLALASRTYTIGYLAAVENAQ